MKDKKHIDQLFKEQFQDFEATPPPAVWDRIEAQLQEKKKERRVIPLWWRVAGVAALIALLLTVGLSLFNSSTSPSNEIVTKDTAPENNTNITETTQEGLDKNKTFSNETDVASEENEINTSEKATINKNEFKTENSSDKKSTTTVAETSNKKNSVVNKTKTSVAETTVNKNRNTTTNKKTNKEYNQPKNASTIYNTKTEAVATSNKPKNATQKSSETTQIPLVKDPNVVVSGTEAVATTKTEKNTEVLDPSEKNILNPTKEIDSKTAVTETSENKKSIFDVIEENKKLEDAVAVKEGPTNRWAVSPNVGPVYYSSLSGGSSLDPMFSDNSQSGNVNLSYGVAVDYAINEKLSVRSGVNNVNLSYATGDVQLASAPPAFALKNVDHGSGRNAITTVFDKGSIRPGVAGGGFGDIVPKSTGGNAELSQELQYYEVPLELKYAVLSKKFGIDVIGGMSTLFLGNNEIIVNDGDFRTVLGEANNLNSISFTSNIGLGFNYQLSKKFRFNIEPMFKYQLNPYTNSSVDFKPYYLGVYSGLSFKF